MIDSILKQYIILKKLVLWSGEGSVVIEAGIKSTIVKILINLIKIESYLP